VAITVAVARNRPRPVAVIVSCAVVLSLVLNVVTIPRFGAAGAAGSALLCSLALAIALTLHERRRVGRIHVVRSCAGPVVAGLAMAAVGLAVPLPLAAHVLVTAAAYVLGLAAVEGLCCRDDLALFRRALVPRLFRRGVQRVA
jgi:O-antigen/teichoic acid export membrane protein